MNLLGTKASEGSPEVFTRDSECSIAVVERGVLVVGDGDNFGGKAALTFDVKGKTKFSIAQTMSFSRTTRMCFSPTLLFLASWTENANNDGKKIRRGFLLAPQTQLL